MTTEYDAKRRQYVARLRVKKPMPPNWNLRVGDVLHCIRSSMDSVAYALALRHSGMPSEKEATDIQFLICGTVAEFRKREMRRHGRIASAARAAIERLQPYHRTDLTVRHPLSVLSDLSNLDKHRRPVVILTAATEAGVTITGRGVPPGTRVGGWHGPFKDRTEIALWAFPLSGGRMAHPKVDVRGDLAIDIQFAEPGKAVGGSVLGFLWLLHHHVRDIVFPTLEPFLT